MENFKVDRVQWVSVYYQYWMKVLKGKEREHPFPLWMCSGSYLSVKVFQQFFHFGDQCLNSLFISLFTGEYC